jgi:hypothetical protein
MSKELIEQLAKEHGIGICPPAVPMGQGLVVKPMTLAQLIAFAEAFAKAYAQTQGQSIPPTHKLVPIEPTHEMREQGWQAYRDSNHPAPYNMLADAYRAMLNAAPIESGVKG